MGQKVLLDEAEARAVLACLQKHRNPESSRLVEVISNKIKSTPLMDTLRQEGIDHYYKEGEVEIDEGAIVSMDDSPGAEITGAYVMGWVWVDLPDPPDDKAAEEAVPS